MGILCVIIDSVTDKRMFCFHFSGVSARMRGGNEETDAIQPL